MFMPLVLALLALGGAGTIAYFATRKPDAPAMMLPGQTWQVFGLAAPMTPWDDTAKANARNAIVADLQNLGGVGSALVLDGDWTPDSPVVIDGVNYPTFLVALQPNVPVPVWKTPVTRNLKSSVSLDYYVITALAQAPANIPAPAATIGTSYNAFS
jgi:hypothetical protein